MNLRLKRVLAAFLAWCMVLTLFPMLPIKSDAAAVFYWPLSTSYGITTGYTDYANHNGVDMAAPQGTPVYATFSGTAVYYQAYTTINGVNYLTSFGNHVWITSSDGIYKAVYAHLNSFEGFSLTIPSSQTQKKSGSTGKITIGSKNVQEGDLLGYVGTTGNSTGNHLHFGLKVNGTYVNPTGYLNQSQCAGSGSSGGDNTSVAHAIDSNYSGYLPIHAYPISTGNVAVYDVNGSAYSNRYITGSTDLCIILEIYTDGWCKVKYPSSAESSGYFTAYVLLSEFIPNASLSSWTAGGSATAYRRSTGSDTIGSVSSGDSGLQVSSANGRIQVIYPVTGQSYYKMGWIAEGNSSSGSGNSGTVATSYLLPCYSYPISTGNISVYDSGHNKYSNRYITGSTDKCIIREIYTDGWCYVSYPSSAESDGWFEAYVPLSEFISNANPVAWTATGNYTAYRRSSGTETIGSITSGDSCVVVSEANGRMQVMYPVTGQNYYKMGWIDASLANNPQGVVDSVSGGIYSVSVRGWAFDKDDTNASLEIHVYIGGVCHAITANTERADVNSAYGCGNYHGFDATITVDKSLAGSKTVEVYAINVGSGTNVLLGSSTVTIGSDTTAPVISNVSVTDITSSGYTVTCTVTDDNGVDRVQFPTWTTNNGQDDLFADWNVNSAASGTKDGNTYTYKVYTSAHNYEGGEYTTHIYAFDKYGNQSQYNVPTVQVPIDVVSVDFDSLELEFDTLGESEQLTAYVYPDNATDQTLTWSTSDASVAVVENGLVTAVGYGTATITATANNGVYAACVVTVVEATLEKIEIATAPTKTVYEIGESLDTSGMTLTATYSNGTTQTITGGYTVSGFDSSTAGSKTVTVTYAGKSTTFVVTVNESASESGSKIVVESKAALPGETITVTISVQNNPGIASMKLKVAYEDALTLTSVDYNSSIGGQYMQPSKMNSPVTLNWFNGLANSEGDWTFVTLTFVVSEDVEPNTSTSITVTYDADDVYDITENNVHFAVENGTIEIVDYTPGDVNGDGAVNNKDLTRLFKYLSNYDVEVVEAALDINGDGAVNNKDLTRLFQYLSNYNVEIF